MKRSLRLLGICGLTLISVGSLVSIGFAQATPQAPPTLSPEVASKLHPTGFAANGGSLTNGVYSNSLYRFSLKVPLGWAVVPSPDREPETVQGRLIPNLQINRTLLIMTENAPLKKSTARKSLQIVATRLATKPGPTAAEDFITYSVKTSKERGMPVVYKGNPGKVTIHGQSFSKATLTQTTDGEQQQIEQYVTLRGQNLLQFVLISPTEAGFKDLEPTIESLEFKTDEPAKSAQRTQKK
jgi:hypothetical protein